MRLRNIAKFELTIEWLEKNQTQAMRIFANCIILRAEMHYEKNAIVYTAHSHFFPKLTDGEAPRDVMWVSDIEDGLAVEPCW